MRDREVHKKVDEREDIAKSQVTPVDTKWIDTHTQKVHAHQATNCGKNNQNVAIDQICMQGLSSIESVEGNDHYRSESQEHFLNHALRRVRCAFHARVQETCNGTIMSGGQNRRPRWKNGWWNRTCMCNGKWKGCCGRSW